MCLVVAAVDASSRYELLFAANRDERHARPTAAAAWWPELPGVFGGRDLVAQGTWLGVDRAGRLAAVTNFREIDPAPAPESRGALVADYLRGALPPREFAASLGPRLRDYGPFSLLLREPGGLRYVSNRAAAAELGPGVHALSNAAYGVEWPKVRSARASMARLLEAHSPVEALFALLAERAVAETAEERYMTSHFVVGPVYGTRSSTVVLIDRGGLLTFAERSFDSSARVTGEVRESFALARG
ncbi:MAG TPA: NRDE family protein [Gammaproteobacteria bacterium]|nr:NRDE family protein [Gammaproteobacteria bacterium]